MKTRSTLVLLIVLLVSAPFTRAQNQPGIPDIINQGFNAYAQTGMNSAVQLWLQNSLLDRATLMKTEMAALKQADATYGLFEKGEIIRQVALTPRVTRYYLVLYYERAPLWAYFDLYKLRGGNQVISDLYFNNKVQVILPSEMLVQ